MASVSSFSSLCFSTVRTALSSVACDPILHLSKSICRTRLTACVCVHAPLLQVEAVLQSHPAVAQAAVFGIENALLGETVACAVTLVPTWALVTDTFTLTDSESAALAAALKAAAAGQPLAAATDLPLAKLVRQLQAWCQQRLAHYKVPTHVYIMAALPTTGSGKVLKTELRRALAPTTNLRPAATAQLQPNPAPAAPAAVDVGDMTSMQAALLLSKALAGLPVALPHAAAVTAGSVIVPAVLPAAGSTDAAVVACREAVSLAATHGATHVLMVAVTADAQPAADLHGALGEAAVALAAELSIALHVVTLTAAQLTSRAAVRRAVLAGLTGLPPATCVLRMDGVSSTAAAAMAALAERVAGCLAGLPVLRALSSPQRYLARTRTTVVPLVIQTSNTQLATQAAVRALECAAREGCSSVLLLAVIAAYMDAAAVPQLSAAVHQAAQAIAATHTMTVNVTMALWRQVSDAHGLRCVLEAGGAGLPLPACVLVPSVAVAAELTAAQRVAAAVPGLLYAPAQTWPGRYMSSTTCVVVSDKRTSHDPTSTVSVATGLGQHITRAVQAGAAHILVLQPVAAAADKAAVAAAAQPVAGEAAKRHGVALHVALVTADVFASTPYLARVLMCAAEGLPPLGSVIGEPPLAERDTLTQSAVLAPAAAAGPVPTTPAVQAAQADTAAGSQSGLLPVIMSAVGQVLGLGDSDLPAVDAPLMAAGKDIVQIHICTHMHTNIQTYKQHACRHCAPA